MRFSVKFFWCSNHIKLGENMGEYNISVKPIFSYASLKLNCVINLGGCDVF